MSFLTKLTLGRGVGSRRTPLRHKWHKLWPPGLLFVSPLSKMCPVKNMAVKSGLAGFMALNSFTLKKGNLPRRTRAPFHKKEMDTFLGEGGAVGGLNVCLGSRPLPI